MPPTLVAQAGAVKNIVRVGVKRAEVRDVRVVDVDYVITLVNGKRIRIPEGAVRTMMDANFTVVFDDSELVGREVLQSAGPLEITPLDGTTVDAFAGTRDGVAGQASAVRGTGDAVVSGSSSSATASGTGSVQASATAQGVAAAPAAAESTGMFSFLNKLPPGLGALGALGALGGSGSGGGTTTTTTTVASESTNLLLSGTFAAGPVLAADIVEIRAFKADGTFLGTTYVGANSTYSMVCTGQGAYVGAIIVVAYDRNGNAVDYRDEATGAGLSLNESLTAVGYKSTSTTLTINITPATHAAAAVLGGGGGS